MTTIEAVRHYTIKRTIGSTTFKCLFCKHSVTAQQFSSENGSRRTQAARALNDHAAAEHGRPIPMSTRNAQMSHAH